LTQTKCYIFYQLPLAGLRAFYSRCFRIRFVAVQTSNALIAYDK